MPRSTMSLMTFVHEIVSMIDVANSQNGNLRKAVDKIAQLRKQDAMAVVAYVCDQIHGQSNYGAFLRVLELRMSS